MSKDMSRKELMDNSYMQIENFRDKLGEVFFDAIMEEDNSTYEMSKCIISVFDKCKTPEELDIADSMMAAVCGYGIKSLIDKIKERDLEGFEWSSC